MNVSKMIVELREQITMMEETVVALEKLEVFQTGHKKRGRPPLPKCERGCGKPAHRGQCRGFGAKGHVGLKNGLKKRRKGADRGEA